MIATVYDRPFRHWTVDDFVEPKSARAAYESVVCDSEAAWVRYENADERKRACNDLSTLGPDAVYLAAALHSQDWLPKLAIITGVPNPHCDPTWHGGGYHVTEAGGYLGPHIDYALNPKTGMERRANLILFLSPEWRSEWGGALCLWNDDATEIQARIFPASNRAVLWCPGDTTFHSVEPVAAGAPPRVSLACYYVTAPRPGVNRKRALFIPQRGAMT